MDFAEFLATDRHVTALVLARVSADDKFALARVSRRTFKLLAPECQEAASHCGGINGLGKLGSIVMLRAKPYTEIVIQGIGIAAAKHNRPELVKHIIAEKTPERLNACLYGACFGGHTELVQELLDLGATDITRGLNHACAGGHIALAEILIAKGARTAKCMQKAVIHGHTELVSLLLRKHRCCSRLAFLSACERGIGKLVKMLIKGSIHHLAFGLRGACRGGWRKIAEKLIELGAPTTPEVVRRCVGVACECGHLDIAKWILSLNPTPGAIQHGLIGACSGGHPEIAEEMMALGATNFSYGLLSACSSGQLKTAEMMIDRGADNLNTALVRACSYGHAKIANMLISRGAVCHGRISRLLIPTDARLLLEPGHDSIKPNDLCRASKAARSRVKMIETILHH